MPHISQLVYAFAVSSAREFAVSKAQFLGVLLIITIVAVFAFGAGVSVSPKEKVSKNFSVQAYTEVLRQWEHDETITRVQIGEYHEQFEILMVHLFAASGEQRWACRLEAKMVCKLIPEPVDLTVTPES